MKAKYRASKQVRMGVPDEHAYNMFLSVMQICHRLGLWETVLKEKRLHMAWQKLTEPMRVENLRRKYVAQRQISKAQVRTSYTR